MKKKQKGSFTLEAAIIMPVTMAVIAALLLFAISVHDGVVMNTVSTAAILENAGSFTNDPENIPGTIRDMLSKRLIIAKNIAVDVDEEQDQYMAICSGSFQIASGFLRMFTGEEMTNIRTNVSISNLDGRKTLLKYKTICDGLEDLTKEGKG